MNFIDGLVKTGETSWAGVRSPQCIMVPDISRWRHQMETFSALLALCAGNSPVPVNSPHKGQWRGALMFSLICARINNWVNNREAGDLRRHRGHYDVNVMSTQFYPLYNVHIWKMSPQLSCGDICHIWSFKCDSTELNDTFTKAEMCLMKKLRTGVSQSQPCAAIWIKYSLPDNGQNLHHNPESFKFSSISVWFHHCKFDLYTSHDNKEIYSDIRHYNIWNHSKEMFVVVLF